MTEFSRRIVCNGLAACVLTLAGRGVGASAGPDRSSEVRPSPAGPSMGEKTDTAHPRSLSDMSAAHFESLVGQEFDVGGDRVLLRRVNRSDAAKTGFRQPFSLMFAAPKGADVHSQVLAVSHREIGRHDLLVTQILNGADGTVLQICFG